MKQFDMSEEDERILLDACKAVPYMVFGGMEPSSPQENANRAWQALGDKMGFVWDTVKGSGGRTFRAEPMEPKKHQVDPSADCSAAALKKVDAKKIEALAEAIYAAKDAGYTPDEVAVMLVARGEAVDALSVRPRVSALKKRRILFPTGERRDNDKGNGCAVLIHRMYWKGVS